jgi:hypothetical protein
MFSRSDHGVQRVDVPEYIYMEKYLRVHKNRNIPHHLNEKGYNQRKL